MSARLVVPLPKEGSPTDAEIIRHFLDQRDAASFEDLYDRHTPYLLRVALRMLDGNHSAAEDALQEAWIRAVTSLPRFRGDSSVRTWLCGITLNCCRETWRRKPTVPLDDVAESADETPGEAGRLDAIGLDRALRRLDEASREAIELFDVLGHSHEEIGEILNIAPGTSKSRLFRARETIEKTSGHRRKSNEEERRMSDAPDKEWTQDEARALRELGSGEAPASPDLKSSVVQRLSDLGLLSSRSRRERPWIPWVAAAAMTAVGFGLGRASVSTSPPGAVNEKRYVLFLNGGGSSSAAENDSRRREYGDWLSGLRRRGLGVSGEELVGESHELPGPLTGGPVVGYFVINARDETDALAIARTTPHLRHGGSVTIAALR